MPRTGCGVLIAARIGKILEQRKGQSGSLDRAGSSRCNPPLVAFQEIRVMRASCACYTAAGFRRFRARSSRKTTASRRHRPGKTPHDSRRPGHAFPGTIQLTVDATDVTRRHFPDPRAHAGHRRRRLRPALSEVAAGRSRAARRHQQGRRASSSPPTGSRSNGSATRSTSTRSTSTFPPESRRSTSSSSTSRRPTGEPGSDRRDARHGEHPVDLELALPGRLLRPADPGPGDASSSRTAGQVATALRPSASDPATASTIR